MPNKFLQSDQVMLSCLLLAQKSRHQALAAEERRYGLKVKSRIKMSDIFECKFVSQKFIGSIKLESRDRELFVAQYRSELEETKGVFGVVYMLRAERPYQE